MNAIEVVHTSTDMLKLGMIKSINGCEFKVISYFRNYQILKRNPQFFW